MLFVSFPVADVAVSTRFYEAIGCTRNPQFSNEQVSSMAWSGHVVFQLMTRAFYASLTPRPIGDAHATSLALFALSCDSREAVDAMVEAAVGAGGKGDISEPHELDFMYGRSFEDPDGNGFGPFWMDMSATPRPVEA
jgi:predicted lactoylglutathione lyase